VYRGLLRLVSQVNTISSELASPSLILQAVATNRVLLLYLPELFTGNQAVPVRVGPSRRTVYAMSPKYVARVS
jgi:hypothetical protein